MNGLSRLLAPDEGRDALRKLAGLLIGVGLFMTFERKSGGSLGGGWGDWGLFATLLIAFAFLYGVGMLGGLSTEGLRPWGSVYLVFGVLLAPFVLFQLIAAVNGTPDASLNVFWVFGATAVLAVATTLVAGLRYGFLLASISVIVSWSALWNKILSNGIGAHFGIYRGLLLILAALLLAGAFAVYVLDRDARVATLAGSGADLEPGFSAANEIVTGAALAAVLAGGLSFPEVVTTPVGLPAPDSSLLWELALLVTSLLAVGYGSRFGARGTSYVGGIGLALFLVIAGSDVNDSSPEGKIVGWPLALVVVGALAFAASVIPGLKIGPLGLDRLGPAGGSGSPPPPSGSPPPPRPPAGSPPAAA